MEGIALARLLRRAVNPTSIIQSYTFATRNLTPPVNGIRQSSSTIPIKSTKFEDEPARGQIYEGPLSQQLFRVKLFSFTTSGLGLLLQPKIYLQTLSGDIPVAAAVGVFGMVSVFTYVTPLLIHYMAKRYVSSITYDRETDVYTAITYTFFLQKREHKFKVEDVVVPEVPGMFTAIHIKKPNGKKVPLFVTDSAFFRREHFERIMGYDKPIDFHMGNLVEETLASKKAKDKQ